jgi:hypothetical protein
VKIEKPSLSRAEKNLVHFGIILLIVGSCLYEGAGLKDWTFLLLSVVVEIT